MKTCIVCEEPEDEFEEFEDDQVCDACMDSLDPVEIMYLKQDFDPPFARPIEV